MRWLFHASTLADWERARAAGTLVPASLAREGCVHTSYRVGVAASARLYLPKGEPLAVLAIDPRRLDARIEVVDTPRGPMPHVHGAIPRDAVAEAWELAAFERAVDRGEAPDRVTGSRFGFVAFEGMTLLDLVGALDPVARIASMGFDPASTCEVIGVSGDAVWEGAGAALRVARVRPPLDAFDVLVIPGGPAARALAEDREIAAWLATFPANRLAASVCTGALLLGAAGRLRGRRATTHASALDRLAAFGATAVRERVVDEGQLVTAGGVTCALDLGLHLVRRIEGDETAARIALQMEML
jgi:cyclohexyl-isocyanide hydratase